MTLTPHQNKVDDNRLPPFSLKKYERRLKLVGEGIKGNGLDALVVDGASSFAGRDLGQVNATYLTNYTAVIDLKALATTCDGEGRYEFFCSAPPQPITGAVGSPVDPLAIF